MTWDDIANIPLKFFEGLAEGIFVPILEIVSAKILFSLFFKVQSILSTIPQSEMGYFLILCLLVTLMESSIITYLQRYYDAFKNPVYFVGYLIGMIALLGSAIKIQDSQLTSDLIGIIFVIILGIITKIFVYLKFERNN